MPSHFLSRPPLLQRGGSGFSLVFVVRDAKGMVEGTCNGWVGADHPWPPPKVGEVAEGRPTEGAPEALAVSRFKGTPTADETVGARQCPSAAQHQSPSRPPEAAAAEASLEVERLQGAIAALGEGNPLSAPLQAALRSARTKSKVLRVNERVEACKGFVERAKKRLVRTHFRGRIEGKRGTSPPIAGRVRGTV